jgi:hypothetical protein
MQLKTWLVWVSVGAASMALYDFIKSQIMKQ